MKTTARFNILDNGGGVCALCSEVSAAPVVTDFGLADADAQEFIKKVNIRRNAVDNTRELGHNTILCIIVFEFIINPY